MPAPSTRPGQASAAKARVLSGIQPSGRPHLGNYFGAIQQHLELQHEYPGEAFYFLASFHALTTIQDGAELRQLTRDATLDYLALGLDPALAVFFDQADVPEVCELAWILTTVTGMGLLEKGVAYKEKIAKGISPSVGLFTYPALQAADILIYHSTLVPVGEDQVQHIEFTRDMAGYFNNAYGGGEEILPLPTYRLSAGKRVPGTDGQKMSKSYGNAIGIFDEGKELSKKVMGIKTASVPLGQPLDTENDTVLALYRLIASPEETADMERRYREGQVGYGQAKKELLAKLDAHFAPARERRRELEKDPDVVGRVLTRGGERARTEARGTLDRVRQVCGLGRDG